MATTPANILAKLKRMQTPAAPVSSILDKLKKKNPNLSSVTDYTKAVNEIFTEAGVLKKRETRLNGNLHSFDGEPALVTYSNGVVVSQKWYKNGDMHREGAPASIDLFEDGTLYCESWRLERYLHREDGPAETFYYKSGNKNFEVWYRNGDKHNDNAPAEIQYSSADNVVSCELYYQHDKVHRTDGPAIIAYPCSDNQFDKVTYSHYKKGEPLTDLAEALDQLVDDPEAYQFTHELIDTDGFEEVL